MKDEYKKIRPKYKSGFYYRIALIMLAILLMVLIILVSGCAEPEYPVLEYEPDVISYSNNFIKLTSESTVVLENGMGHMDKWLIKEGVTFELIVHEPEDWIRFYDTPDFITTSDRIYCIGEGRDHITDFTALHPTTYPYYFTIDVIINGVMNTVDYMVIYANP